MKALPLLIGILVSLLSACGGKTLEGGDTIGDGGGPFRGATCTEIAAAGLYISVNVPQGWDAQALRSKLSIQVTDANGPIDVSPSSGNPAELLWSGAYENAGPFKITVRLGTVTNSLSNVVSAKDSAGCHVTGARVQVSFSPPANIDITQDNVE